MRALVSQLQAKTWQADARGARACATLVEGNTVYGGCGNTDDDLGSFMPAAGDVDGGSRQSSPIRYQGFAVTALVFDKPVKSAVISAVSQDLRPGPRSRKSTGLISNGSRIGQLPRTPARALGKSRATTGRRSPDACDQRPHHRRLPEGTTQ